MITNNPYDRNNAAELDRDDVLADERRHDDKLVASGSVPEPRTADGSWTDRDDRTDVDDRTDLDERTDRDGRTGLDDRNDLNAETAPVGVAGSAAVTSREAADEAHRDTAGDLADPDAESVAVHETGHVTQTGPGTVAGTGTETGTVDDIDFDDRWRDIKAAFVDDPRESVEKADALIDEALSALTSTRQSLVDQWKNSGTNDTEQLRLALREYRNLFDRLKG